MVAQGIRRLDWRSAARASEANAAARVRASMIMAFNVIKSCGPLWRLMKNVGVPCAAPNTEQQLGQSEVLSIRRGPGRS
jgi:hypothetical protein